VPGNGRQSSRCGSRRGEVRARRRDAARPRGCRASRSRATGDVFARKPHFVADEEARPATYGPYRRSCGDVSRSTGVDHPRASTSCCPSAARRATPASPPPPRMF
jgi:hypothetical protein